MTDKRRNVELVCSICGCNDFITDKDFKEMSDDEEIKCGGCGHVFTKAELIKENKERIDAKIDELVENAFKGFEKELKELFSRKVKEK